MFYAIMNVFRKFGDRNIVLANSPFVSGSIGDLLHTTCGTHCVFPANDQSENWIATILIARTLWFLQNGSQAKSRLSSFGNLNLIHRQQCLTI